MASAVLMTTVVYAHNEDVNKGCYTNNQQRDLKFRITKSAQTSLMNKEVYESALNWNGISSNVHVSVIMESPGMPTISDTMYVYGSAGENVDDPHALGLRDYGITNYYDSSHNMLENYNTNISYYYRVSCTHYAKEKGLFGKSQSEDNVSDSVWVP